MFERLSKFVRAAALMTAFVGTLLYCGTKERLLPPEVFAD